MTRDDRHIELVEAVNNAKTQREHDLAEAKLEGFRAACECYVGRNIGALLMDCDRYYMAKGIDRPMCCGVFLDWSPQL
jgi:hypothetical protein